MLEAVPLGEVGVVKHAGDFVVLCLRQGLLRLVGLVLVGCGVIDGGVADGGDVEGGVVDGGVVIGGGDVVGDVVGLPHHVGNEAAQVSFGDWI